jgi:hypothetical protein
MEELIFSIRAKEMFRSWEEYLDYRKKEPLN